MVNQIFKNPLKKRISKVLGFLNYVGKDTFKPTENGKRNYPRNGIFFKIPVD